MGITVESKPKAREVVYREGMSLRQFLRENPRSTMDVVEKYFTRKEIMKDIPSLYTTSLALGLLSTVIPTLGLTTLGLEITSLAESPSKSSISV